MKHKAKMGHLRFSRFVESLLKEPSKAFGCHLLVSVCSGFLKTTTEISPLVREEILATDMAKGSGSAAGCVSCVDLIRRLSIHNQLTSANLASILPFLMASFAGLK